MFKMGCSMARKILAPGSGSSSNNSAGQDQLATGVTGFSSSSSASNAPQKDKRKQASGAAGENNNAGPPRLVAGKTTSGDELNDFSKLQDDPRLPLNVRQIFKITKSWKAIARTMSKTGTAMFLNLFEQNQDLFYLFDRFQHLKGKELHDSMELREHAATVMSTLDQSINTLSDYDNFVSYLHSIGQLHRKVPGFKREYFWKIEQPFMKAIKQTLDERCNETIEQIYIIAIKLIIETIAEGYGSDEDNNVQKSGPKNGANGGGNGKGGGSGASGPSDGKTNPDSELTRRHKSGGQQENSNESGKDNFASGGAGGGRQQSAGVRGCCLQLNSSGNEQSGCADESSESSSMSVTYDAVDVVEDAGQDLRLAQELVERHCNETNERDNCLRESKQQQQQLDKSNEWQQQIATKTIAPARGQQESLGGTKQECQLREAVLVRATCKLMETTSSLLDNLNLCPRVDSSDTVSEGHLIYEGGKFECGEKGAANGSNLEPGAFDRRADDTGIGADLRKLLANLNELLIVDGGARDESPGSEERDPDKSVDSLSSSPASSLLSSCSLASQYEASETTRRSTPNKSRNRTTASGNNGANNNNNNSNSGSHEGATEASDNNLIKTQRRPMVSGNPASGANQSHRGKVGLERKFMSNSATFDCCPLRNKPILKPEASNSEAVARQEMDQLGEKLIILDKDRGSDSDCLDDQPTVAGNSIEGGDEGANERCDAPTESVGACHFTIHGPIGQTVDLANSAAGQKSNSNNKSLGRQNSDGPGEGINQHKAVATDSCDECNDKCQSVHGLQQHIAIRSSAAEFMNIPPALSTSIPPAQLCPNVLSIDCGYRQRSGGSAPIASAYVNGTNTKTGTGNTDYDDDDDVDDRGGNDLIATEPKLGKDPPPRMDDFGQPEAESQQTGPRACATKPLAMELGSAQRCPLTSAACGRAYRRAEASAGAHYNPRLPVALPTTKAVAGTSVATTRGRGEAAGKSIYQHDYHCDCSGQLSYGNVFRDPHACRQYTGLARSSGAGLKWPPRPLAPVRCKQAAAAAGRQAHSRGRRLSGARTKGRRQYWRPNVNESPKQATSLSLQQSTCAASLGSISPTTRRRKSKITCVGSSYRVREQSQFREVGLCKQEEPSVVGLEQSDLRGRQEQKPQPQGQYARLVTDDLDRHDVTANGLFANCISQSSTGEANFAGEPNEIANDNDNTDTSSVQSAKALLHSSEQAVLKLLLANGEREREDDADVDDDDDDDDDDSAACAINEPAAGCRAPNTDLHSGVELGELIRMLLLINRLAFSLACSSKVNRQLRTKAAAKPQKELAQGLTVTQIEVAGSC